MKYHVRLFLYLVCIYAASCNSTHLRLISEQIVDFDLPFEPASYSSGCLPDKDNGYLLYFSNLETQKQTAFCNKAGKVLKTIPLQEGITALTNVDAVAAINRDSLVALSIVNNSLIILGPTGHIILRNELPLTYRDSGYLLIANNITSPAKDGSLYAALFPDPAPFTPPGNPAGFNAEAYYASKVDAPRVVRLSGITSPRASYQMLLKGIERRFRPAMRYADIFALKFDHSDTHLFYASAFGDSLYKIEVSSDRIVKTAPIIWGKTKIGYIPPTTIDGLEKATDMYNYKAVFPKLTYDSYRHLIYLSLYHEVAENTAPANSGPHREWTLFVFNEDLNCLLTTDFGSDAYDPTSLIASPDGFWLRKINKGNEARRIQFQLFKIQ